MSGDRAYSSLAELYDSLMSYVPYHNWAEMIGEIRDRYFKGKYPSIFELGGGTGTLGSILTFEEYPYLGSDISASMCEVAWAKGLDYICTDCRSIALDKKFDLIIFCFDGINYLPTKEDFQKAFQEVHKHLKENGFFFFDITTLNNSRNYFADYTEAESFENGSYIRHSFFDECTSQQHNDFDIYLEVPDEVNRFSRHREEHVQYVFPVETVESWIPKSLFRIEAIWGDFELKKYSPLSERVHFLLQKKGLA